MQDGPLYGRYTITHKDGKPVDPGKRYFVLAVDTDAGAIPALVAYVDAIKATHPTLAADLQREYQLPTRASAPLEYCDWCQRLRQPEAE